MPTIDNNLCTVLIVCDFDASDRDVVIERAKAAMPVFAMQPGFVSASLHVGENDNRLVQYLQWKTTDDHYACQKAPDWKSNEAAMGFWMLVEQGKLKVDAQIYAIEQVDG